MKRYLYDASGGVLSTVEETTDGQILFGQFADHQSVLDDNQRARSMGRTVDTAFEPVARYHPSMVVHWLNADGIRPSQFVKWPAQERFAYLERKVQSRDYRKFMRRHQKGLFV